MKKYIFTFIAMCFCSIACAQMKLCAHFDGYWGDWQTYYLRLRGDYGGFIIYIEADGPWNPLFKFSIDNFYIPDKDTRKSYLKNNWWYEYSGTVEYYISDDYPTAYSGFRANKRPCFVTKSTTNGRPIKKITSRATIKIAPYKDHPKVYNIWYDNVGLGIDLNNLYF